MASETAHDVPAPVAMMGLITGYWVSQAVGVIATLGVADHLRAGSSGQPASVNRRSAQNLMGDLRSNFSSSSNFWG